MCFTLFIVSLTPVESHVFLVECRFSMFCKTTRIHVIGIFYLLFFTVTNQHWMDR